MNLITMEKSCHSESGFNNLDSFVDEPKGIRGCPTNGTAGLLPTGKMEGKVKAQTTVCIKEETVDRVKIGVGDREISVKKDDLGRYDPSDLLRVSRCMLGVEEEEEIEDIESLMREEEPTMKVLVGNTFLPKMFVRGKFRGVEAVDKVGFGGREAGDAWKRGDWAYMVLLEYRGCKLIAYRGTRSWGLKHSFDDCTDIEGDPAEGKFVLTCSVKFEDYYVLPTVVTIPPWMPNMSEILATYSKMLGSGAAEVRINTDIKTACPPEIRPFTKFKEGGFNPWGNGQTALIYVELLDLGGQKVTMWNIYLPASPNIAQDQTIMWWDQLLLKEPTDSVFQLYIDQSPGSFVGITYDGSVPTTPFDVVTSPVLYLPTRMHVVAYPRIMGLGQSVLFWSSKHPIRLSGILSGHVPLDGAALRGIKTGKVISKVVKVAVSDVENSSYIPTIREGFNPYGNGQPGIYLIGKEALTALGVKTDHQGGAYMKYPWMDFKYLQQVKDCARLGGGESIGSCLVAFTHGHQPKEKKEKAAPQAGFKQKDKGGYRRAGLTTKKFDERVKALLDLYNTESELAEAFFRGSISWSMFREVAQYYDLSQLDTAFLRACGESEGKGLGILATRSDLKIRKVWFEGDKLLDYAKKPIFCDQYGVEDLDPADLEINPDSQEEDQWEDELEDVVEEDELDELGEESEEEEIPKKKTEPEPKVKEVDVVVGIMTGETREVMEAVLGEHAMPSSEFEKMTLHNLTCKEWTTKEWQALKGVSREVFYAIAAREYFRDLIRPQIGSWATGLPMQLLDDYSSQIEKNPSTVFKLFNKDPMHILEVRDAFDMYCKCRFVLSGKWDESVLEVKDKEMIAGLCSLTLVEKVLITTTSPALGIDHKFLAEVEIAEALKQLIPRKEQSLADAQLKRLQNEFSGSHTAISTNSQLADVDMMRNEEPTTAAKDGTEYVPYPRESDRYEPYPRKDEQYIPYPKAAPVQSPAKWHWSQTAGSVLFGANNYIGKDKTAGGKWNGYNYDYNVPALNRADEIAKTHDAMLEAVPEPMATQLTKEIHGPHYIITALEWNNAITKIFSILFFFTLFLEGGFNPYGNGQTEPVLEVAATAADVVAKMSTFLVGNWQMTQDTGGISDLVKRGSVSIDAVPLDLVLSHLTCTAEQVNYASRWTIVANAVATPVANLFDFRNAVTLGARRPTSLDPLEYLVNPNFHEYLTTAYAPPKTLREWAALVGQNNNYPNAITASAVLGQLDATGSGFILPFTKLFMSWFRTFAPSTSNPIPYTLREAHDIINHPAGILNPTVLGTSNFVGPVDKVAPVYPVVFTATMTDINHVLREVDNAVPAIFPQFNKFTWGDIMNDDSIAVVPVGDWNGEWTSAANLLWILMFMEYPWGIRSVDHMGGNSRWAHTSELVRFRGPTEKIILVSAAQRVTVRVSVYNAAAGAMQIWTFNAAENIYNGVPFTATANQDIYEAWAQLNDAARIGAFTQIITNIPSIVTDVEVMTALVNALTYTVRLAPDIVNDTANHSFTMTRVGALAAYEPDSPPIPSMLLNGLIPRSTLARVPVNSIASDGHDSAAVSYPTAPEMVGRVFNIVVPKSATFALSRTPFTSLAPLTYMCRFAYCNLLLTLDKFLKSIELPRMLAYGAWSGFSMISGPRDHCKMEYLICSIMSPAARPTLITTTNPPHTAPHIAYVGNDPSRWYPVGLYTGLDRFLVGERTFDITQLKFNPTDWVSTVAGNVFYKKDKKMLLDDFSAVFANMNNAPATTMVLVSEADRGAAILGPKAVWRHVAPLRLNYSAGPGLAAVHVAISNLPANQATFLYKGYCWADTDLADGMPDVDKFFLTISAQQFNLFPNAGISKTYTTNLLAEIPLVDAGSGIEYNDKAIKRLRAIQAGNPSIILSSKAKNIADKSKDDGMVQAPANFGGANDFVPLALGGDVKSQL